MALKASESLRNVLCNRKNNFSLFNAASLKSIRGIKSFKEVPRAPRIPLFGSKLYYLRAGGHPQMFKYIDNLHKRLGPIFLDKIGKHELLFIADPDANRDMYLREGIYPKHAVLDTWLKALDQIGKGRGLFFMEGDLWYTTRTKFNKIILQQNSMRNHVQCVLEVCQDLMKIWNGVPTINNLNYQLSCWNVECFGEVVFGKRLGFMEKLKGKEFFAKYINEQKFVEESYQVFERSAELYSWPVWLAKIVKPATWNRFVSAMEFVLEQGGTYVQDSIKECKDKNATEKMKESIIYKALAESLPEMLFDEVMIDLFLASPDTITHAASWMLYLLGRNPDVANQARKEILTVLKEEPTITLATIRKIKHIDGIIKETLRLYSIAPFITRTSPSTINFCDYEIPPGTNLISSNITMGRDPNNFTDPESFKPERWWLGRENLKKSSTENDPNSRSRKYENHNTRAYTPWAQGRRSCVGRRMAELNLSCLLIEVLRNFELSVNQEIEMKMRLVSVPSQRIDLNLKPL